MILPIGYLTLSEAAELLLPYKYAGQPDRPEVLQARANGFDVSDGVATNDIIEEIRNAVERGALTAFAIGGHPRHTIRLPADFTKSIPMLWSAKGSFAFVRAIKPAHAISMQVPSVHSQLTGWFGYDLSAVILAFEESQTKKLRRVLLRRPTRGKVGGPGKRGRPSVIPAVQKLIQTIVDEKGWSPREGTKALVAKVNKTRPPATPYSRDTIVFAVDDLHAKTRDRRFERLRRKPARRITRKIKPLRSSAI